METYSKTILTKIIWRFLKYTTINFVYTNLTDKNILASSRRFSYLISNKENF